MDRYTARMNAHGTTQRERYINRLKQDISNKVPSNPSYKTIKLNGEETYLIINSGTQTYYKEFESLPGQDINIGDYIEWKDQIWLVYAADKDDDIYIDGTLRQCNYVLFWQNKSGTIVSRNAWIQNASSYNNGEEEGKVITLQSNQFMVYLPYDDETSELKNGMRMNISKSIKNYKPYKLTRVDDINYSYGEKGLLNIIFTQDEQSVEKDRLITLDNGKQVWICDYNIPIPNEQSSIGSICLKLETSSLIIKPTNKKKSITANLYDEHGTLISDDSFLFNWSIHSDIDNYINYESQNNLLKISLSNECKKFGRNIKIKCTCNNIYQSELTLVTQGVF